MKKSTSRWGATALAVAGLCVVALLVVKSGSADLVAAVGRIGPWFLCVLSLEVVVFTFNTAALGSLYRSAGVPPLGASLWRVSLPAQLLAVAAPAGRLVAETYRAVKLSGAVGKARAAGAAAWMQSVVLGANAVVAVPTAIAVYATFGRSWVTWAVFVYCVVSFGLGLGVVVLGRARLGKMIGKRLPLAREAGPAFDGAFEAFSPARALLYECGGRAALVLQVVVLRHALGASFGLPESCATTGVLLAGAAAGDFVPAQLGATDGPMAFAATTIGIHASDALAITLGLHAVQLAVGVLGTLFASVVWRALPDGVPRPS